MTEPRMVDFALKYAQYGWDVFPLQPRNKIPFREFAWNQLATRDQDKIREWWRKWPEANIGIACGKRSEMVVLDIDAGHGGEESIDILLDLHGKLPDTPQCNTGGGGRHVIFKHPGVDIRNSASKLGLGLDIRGDGGYIVAAPSIHPNGKRYEWHPDYLLSKTQLAIFPKWIIEILLKDNQPKQMSEPEAFTTGAPNKITSGSRNQTLTSLAGTMRKRGMSGEALLAALMAENQARCVPPLDDEDIRKITESVERYDQPEATPTSKRLESEWMLAAAALSSPDIAKQDAGYISAIQFSDPNLEKFWDAIMNGIDHIQAANEAGILRDLSIMQPRINIWDMASYAAQMARNEYLEVLSYRIADLQRAIPTGDTTRAQKIVTEMANILPYSNREPLDGKTLEYSFKMMIENLAGRSIKTGIAPMDRVLGGFERQTFTVLAARPSMGKSTIGWQIARQVVETGGRSIFFSLEMAASQLMAKAACGELGWRWKDLRVNMTEEQRLILRAKAEELGARWGDNLLVDDQPANTEIIWQQTARYKPDIVIVDHLRLVRDRDDSEVKRLGQITQRLKDLAKQYNCHVICLAQLNRAVEGRDQKRPQLSDLRDSGEIEENADNVLMPYRDDYYDNDKAPRAYSETEIWIRKFRDDVLNQKIDLIFDTSHQIFIDPKDAPR